ncbi:MAG TPA: hypothetical protein VGC79_26385 [Polyangiaceae bacterium]
MIGAICASAVLALYTGCGDQSSERRGGGDIPDLTAGSGASSGDGGASGAQNGALVPWCDAYKIINCVCQQCHQNPTRNGAAMPLMTYEDTQEPFPLPTSSTVVWQKMQTAVSSRAMPETGTSVVPTVKPLSDEQQNTLLGWLAQGAQDRGGRDCPMTCDWSDGSP